MIKTGPNTSKELAGIWHRLERSLERDVMQNPSLQTAFSELAVEIEAARVGEPDLPFADAYHECWISSIR